MSQVHTSPWALFDGRSDMNYKRTSLAAYGRGKVSFPENLEMDIELDNATGSPAGQRKNKKSSKQTRLGLNDDQLASRRVDPRGAYSNASSLLRLLTLSCIVHVFSLFFSECFQFRFRLGYIHHMDNDHDWMPGGSMKLR